MKRTPPPRLSEASFHALRQTPGWVRIGTLAAALALIGWLGWGVVVVVSQQRSAEEQVVRATELQASITRLNELMTVLARMAAQTGDRRWAERYEEISPQLDVALAEAVSLATSASQDALASTAGEGHRDLVAMERRAIELAESGRRDAAEALLDGPEFDYLEAVYASGLKVFGEEMRAFTAVRAEALTHRQWIQAMGLGLSAILLAVSALAARWRGRLRRALDRTEVAARTDPLTGLPNRRRLHEILDERLEDGEVALLVLGLDRFKDVNGAHGQAAGDRLLQLAASRLKVSVRPSDVVARLGGDEFAVVVHIGEVAGGDVSDFVAQLARGLTSGVNLPFELEPGVAVQVGVSMGAVLARPEQGAAAALHRAAVALDRAKSDARGGLRFFEPGMDAQVRARALLAAELRQAIVDDALVPHFQPLVDLASGCLIGVEMLARWPHPERGMVSPVDFIPVAEDTGLIAPMTELLMRRACRAAAGWPETVTLACNISPLQLRDTNFPATVAALLDETGLPAHRLELEVTESALVGDLSLARKLLDELRRLGVRLALDDFGTGYSSLRHLQTLPFDKLKIDASFVGAMAGDAESAKIVSAVVALGHGLGMLTVGEGIENADTADRLREMGCDIGQGWFHGRPGPAETVDALVAGQMRAEGKHSAMVA